MDDSNNSPQSLLNKFILRQVIDGLEYNADLRCVKVKTKTVAPKIRDIVIAQADKYGYDPDNAERLLYKVVNEISGQCVPREHTVQYLDCKKLSIADIEITLEGCEDNWGKATLSLLYLGKEDHSGRALFYVLKSDRQGLHPHDIVEPADNRMWGVGHPVFFKAFRDGSRYPSNSRVYRTYKLTQIRLTQRGAAFEVTDTNSSFTFEEHLNGIVQSTGLNFGSNPASMLFKKLFVPCAPICAEYRNGNLLFKSNPDFVYLPSECRDEIFDLVKDLDKSRLQLITDTLGKIAINEDGVLVLKQAAKVTHEAL